MTIYKLKAPIHAPLIGLRVVAINESGPCPPRDFLVGVRFIDPDIALRAGAAASTVRVPPSCLEPV